MKKRAFSTPLRKGEAIFGWIYAFLHIFVLQFPLTYLAVYVLPLIGIKLDAANFNVIYYGVGFIILVAVLFRFLKESFYDLCDNIPNSVGAIIIGYALNLALSYAVMAVLLLVTDNLINPNEEVIMSEAKLNPNTIMAISVFLAPVVEEILFRGVIFGSLRKKSRIWAYVISVLLFAVYHLMDYFLTSYDWTVFIYILQYIPGGIALAYCYERSRNIWASIFLHSLINLISISITIAM